MDIGMINFDLIVDKLRILLKILLNFGSMIQKKAAV